MSEYKRLTEKTIGCFEYRLKDHKPVVGEFSTYEAFYDYSMAVRRLGKYEDIGLSPERIKQILDSRPLYRLEKGQVIVDEDAFNYCNEKLTEYQQIGTVQEFANLAKAKAEGRLVVLSTPIIPFVRSDDQTDSDVYCPACGKTLSGGWPDYHPDQEWTMCQCYHCGQSVDDTKTVTLAEAKAALKKIGGATNG